MLSLGRYRVNSTKGFAMPEPVQKKTSRKTILFQAALDELRSLGWQVERIPGNRKSSLRRLTNTTTSALATIRTSQDRHIAFPRDDLDDCWLTLNDADVVVVAALDDPDARIGAGYTIPIGRGLWLPLYVPESESQPNLVGAGAGLAFPPVARTPLPAEWDGADGENGSGTGEGDFSPLTINEAKLRLAKTLGVQPVSIRITVEA